MLGISTGLNALSDHGACTAIFVAVAAIAGGALASIQTLGKISWLAWVGIACILSSSKPRCPVLLPSQTNVASSYRHDCSRCAGPSGSCAPDRSIQVRLESRGKSNFLRSYLRPLLHGLCLCRYACVLLYHL